MSKFYKILLAVCIVSSLSFNASAQGYWSSRSVSSGITTDKAVARLAYPKEFKLFDLNISPLRQQLFSIVGNQASKHSTIITLPNADGGFEQFEVVEASNFDPALQAKFPEIRAYSGKGITDKYAMLKLSISPQGIQTMVFRTDKEDEFIEPYSQDHAVYSVYKSQRQKNKLPWVCSTVDQKMVTDLNAKVANTGRLESSAEQLKTMRLAQSVTAEYSNYFGAFNASQVGLVLAAINATLTRCNGCYEKDLGVHLNLIPNTSDVIYYDPNTDPYSPAATGAGGAWNGQLQATLTSVIGEANYDIGHLFGATGGGGNAGCIGCVCVNGQKGSGFTSPADGIPMGDNFDIDYVVHEVGHQMGANHTFSFSNEGTGVQKEVGAGITIMGYAGITSYDPAPHSIDIYHEASIAQIQTNLAAKTCPVTTDITANNLTPVVAPVSNYTIPISTPFALTGSATDANGDPLTYCWEQNDNSTTTGAGSVASQTKLTGPNWLSFSPTASPTRYFPRLSTILAGGLTTGPLPGGDAICTIEALSSVARTLNFRLTVRDNHIYSPNPPVAVGQTAFTDMVVTVSSASGPFAVTSPNTNVSWQGGTSQTITWNVNNTTAAPVSCATVNILLSTDGGNTFPTVLASNTANDGTESVVLPSVTTSTARIKVESVGNIFFDISDANFTIAPPPTGFGFNSPAPVVSACPAAATMNITLGTISNGGFTNPITLTASGNPAGTTVSFTPSNIVTPGNNVTVTLNGTNTLSNGSYPITVTGVATGAPNQTANLTYTINAGAAPVINTQPAAQVACTGTNATFTVSATGGTSYQWQLSTDGGSNYNNIGGATTSSYTVVGVTAAMNNYLYRVIVAGQCNTITSASASLTVNTAPSVTAQPTDVSICATGNTSFTAAASGTNITYQWQESTDGGTNYNNLANGGVYSGVLTATLNLTGVTVGMNSYKYRVVVSGTCTPSATSSAATLTVVTSVTVTAQPVNAVVCAGSNTSFTTAGTGTGVIYQWQVNTGSGFANVTNGGVYSGANSATLTITAAALSMNGYTYRAQLSNSICTAPGITNTATLTVNSLPSITAQPTDVTICAAGNTSFTSTGAGTGTGYQWQVNSGSGFTNVANGGVYAGATTSTLSITAATFAMNTYQYRVVVSGTCAPPANSNAATLTVINPVSVTTAPVNSEICSGSNTSFVVAGNSAQTINYQWQVSTDGGTTYTNVANGSVYSGATTNTLNVTAATTTMSTYRYRVLLSNSACTTPTISVASVLTVRQLPSVGLTASTASLLPGQSSTLTATPSSSTGGTISITWSYNSNPLVVTGNTYVANVEKVGTYQVRIQETGWPIGLGNSTLVCSNQSSVVTLDAPVSPKLFIFPSPNNGNFTVSYYNTGGSSTSRTLSIFDSKGSKVYSSKVAITGPYTLVNIDIRPSQGGIFYVEVGDASGKVLAKGKVFIQ